MAANDSITPSNDGQTPDFQEQFNYFTDKYLAIIPTKGGVMAGYWLLYHQYEAGNKPVVVTLDQLSDSLGIGRPTVIEGIRALENLGALLRTTINGQRAYLLDTPHIRFDDYLSLKKGGYVYLIEGAGIYKIGISRTPPDTKRLSQLQTGSPVLLTLVCYHFADDVLEEEERLHLLYDGKRRHGEWFALDSHDVEYIKSLAVQDE